MLRLPESFYGVFCLNEPFNGTWATFYVPRIFFLLWVHLVLYFQSTTGIELSLKSQAALILNGQYIIITLARRHRRVAWTLNQLEKGLPAPPTVPSESRSDASEGQSRISDLPVGKNAPCSPCSPCRRDPLRWWLLRVGFSPLWNTAPQIVTYTRSAFTGKLSQFVNSSVAFLFTFIVPQTCLWCLWSCS